MSDEKPEIGWLQRQWQRLRNFQWRDVIIAEVEKGAENVAVGKYIIQIGTLKVPVAFLILAMVGIAALLLVGLVNLINSIRTSEQTATAVSLLSATPTPDTMSATSFTIAVADFTLTGNDGQPIQDDVVSTQIRQRAVELADYLRNQLQQLEPEVGRPIEVWGPETERIPAIVTDEDAAIAAEQLKAIVLIYAKVKPLHSGEFELLPHFYVRDISVERARELTGPFALGQTIQFDPSSAFGIGEFNAVLQTRLDALARILVAVDAIFRPSPNYERAKTTLERFQKQSSWLTETTGGQEIFYHFLGNAYLGLALDTTDPTEAEAWRQQSLAAYQQAVTINVNYARAYNGLGSIYYRQALAAQQQHKNCLVASAALWEKAAAAYSAVLQIEPEFKASIPYVDFLARYGIASVKLAHAFCAAGLEEATVVDPLYQAAQVDYQKVLDEYATFPNPAAFQTTVAIYAHGGLAKSKLSQVCNLATAPVSALRQAIDHYDTAFALILEQRSQRDIQYGIQTMPGYLVALCHTEQPKQAVNTLENFLATFSETSSPEEIDEIRHTIEQAIDFQCGVSWEKCKYEANRSP